MGRVYLCMGKYATIPYSFDSARIRVFCIEELCFHLKENACLLDKDIFCEPLVDWIEEECGLPDLAKRLRSLLKIQEKPENYVRQIFEYTGYYDPKEAKEIQRQISVSGEVEPAQKQKTRADYYLESRRYVLAMQEYRNILNETQGMLPSFEGQLLHNMGVAQARLFLFEKAAESFERAWRLTGDEKSLLCFLAAMRLHLKEAEYLHFLTEHEEYYEASLKLEAQVVERENTWTDIRNESAIASMRGAFFAGEEETCGRLMREEMERLKDAYRDYVVQ